MILSCCQTVRQAVLHISRLHTPLVQPKGVWDLCKGHARLSFCQTVKQLDAHSSQAVNPLPHFEGILSRTHRQTDYHGAATRWQCCCLACLDGECIEAVLLIQTSTKCQDRLLGSWVCCLVANLLPCLLRWEQHRSHDPSSERQIDRVLDKLSWSSNWHGDLLPVLVATALNPCYSIGQADRRNVKLTFY